MHSQDSDIFVAALGLAPGERLASGAMDAPALGAPRYICTAQESWADVRHPAAGGWPDAMLRAGASRRAVYQALHYGAPVRPVVRPLPD